MKFWSQKKEKRASHLRVKPLTFSQAACTFQTNMLYCNHKRNNLPQGVDHRKNDRNSTLPTRQSIQGWFFYLKVRKTLLTYHNDQGQQCKNEHSERYKIFEIIFHLHHLPSYVIGGQHLAVTRLFPYLNTTIYRTIQQSFIVYF